MTLFVMGKSAKGESKAVKFSKDTEVLVLGPGMKRIDIGMDEDRAGLRCLPMFTKITPGHVNEYLERRRI